MGGHSFSVVLFASVQMAIRAERLLQGAGLEVKLIPVPRQLSSDCGVCLRFDGTQATEVEEILENHGVPLEGIYRLP